MTQVHKAGCISIDKAECINHVTKRMRYNLRSLVKDYKCRKLADGNCREEVD